MDILLAVFGLMAFCLPALLILAKRFKDHGRLSQVLWFVVIGSTLVPLLIFYAQHFVGILFTTKNVWLLIGFINVCMVYVYRFLPTPKTTSTKVSSASIPPFYWVCLVLVSMLVFAYPYFFGHQPLIGGDSPLYLQNSSLLAKNHLPADTYDRSIIDFLPAIITIVTGVSVETIFKIIVTVFEIMFVIIGTKLASHILSPRYSIIVGASLIFSLAEFHLAKFNISFFMGLVLLYFIVAEILDRGLQTQKNILIPLIWGAIFNLHGVVAFASVPILLMVLLINVPPKKWSIFACLTWIFLFIASSQPLIFSQGARLSVGLVKPIIESIQSGTDKPPSSSANNPSSPTEEWVDEYTSQVRPAFTTFPLQAADFIGNYSSIVLIFSLVGLTMLALNPTPPTTAKRSILVLGVSLFLLTQQAFLGLQWFSNRFLLGLGPIITILAVYALDRFGRLLKDDGPAYYAAIACITMPGLLTTLPKISQLTANIAPQNYQFIHQVKSVLPPNAPVFVAGGDGRWMQGLIPSSYVLLTHPAAICSDRSILNTISDELWQASQAFSHNVNSSQSVALFKKLIGQQPYYVYLDPANYHCINGSLFPAPDYSQVARQGELILLRHE